MLSNEEQLSSARYSIEKGAIDAELERLRGHAAKVRDDGGGGGGARALLGYLRRLFFWNPEN